MPYDHSTKIGNQGDVVKHLAASELPVRVVDVSGTTVGSVDRVAVLNLISGED